MPLKLSIKQKEVMALLLEHQRFQEKHFPLLKLFPSVNRLIPLGCSRLSWSEGVENDGSSALYVLLYKFLTTQIHPAQLYKNERKLRRGPKVVQVSSKCHRVSLFFVFKVTLWILKCWRKYQKWLIFAFWITIFLFFMFVNFYSCKQKLWSFLYFNCCKGRCSDHSAGLLLLIHF